MPTESGVRRRRLESNLRRIAKLSRQLRFAADRALTMVDDTVFEPSEEPPMMNLEEVERAEARGATAERARIRQMALDKHPPAEGSPVYSSGYNHALRDFAALLEQP